MIDPYLPFRIGLVQAVMREAIRLKELEEQSKQAEDKQLQLAAEPTGEVLSQHTENDRDSREG